VEEDERGADERKDTQKVYIGKEEFVISDLDLPKEQKNLANYSATKETHPEIPRFKQLETFATGSTANLFVG